VSDEHYDEATRLLANIQHPEPTTKKPFMTEDINQEVLAELRRIRSINRCTFFLVVVFGIVTVLFSRHLPGSAQATSWEQVTTAMRRQDFQQALSGAQALVERQPSYYYGHAYIGAIYLAMNDPTNAEAQYSIAYELFPNEENEKNLAAIRKRLAGSQGTSPSSK
jgi:cytochrome c-type biogenesis protein CcmH/NrfG